MTQRQTEAVQCTNKTSEKHMTEDVITITLATDPSHAGWLAFRQQLYTGVDRQFHLTDMELNVTAAERDCLLAVDADEAMCGMLELSLRNIVDGCLSGPVGYIEGVYVAESHRGLELSRRLLDAGKEWCSQRGCTEIATDSELYDVTAQQFHLSMGFEETCRVVEFRKALTSPE